MKIKDGIILTGGTGSRTSPFNLIFNKHLLPLYNKFVIDFPIASLKAQEIENLIVVLGGEHSEQIRKYFEINFNFGFKSVCFVDQEKPSGIAQAINLCKEHILGDKFFVILGDNYFEKKIKFSKIDKAQIVLSPHEELTRFGVVSIKQGQIKKIEEKPQKIDDISFDSNFAMTGFYLFDKKFFNYFENIKISKRKEYEIVDIINQYFKDDSLYYVVTDGIWSDAGTLESIYKVGTMIREKALKK